jgi:CRP-like cAMP-binding protein
MENGEVLTITYDKLLELYFQNPEFGYYFLRLTTERLMQNISRLEGVVMDQKAQLDALTGGAESAGSAQR